MSDLLELSRLVADPDVKLSPGERGRVARYLALCQCQRSDHPHKCGKCGAPFEQPDGRSRPRKYCLDCSPRRRPLKSREKSKMAA